jgi:hypothetical protein
VLQAGPPAEFAPFAGGAGPADAARTIVDRIAPPLQPLAAARFDKTTELWLQRQDWAPNALGVAPAWRIGRAIVAGARIGRGEDPGVDGALPAVIESIASDIARADALRGAVAPAVAGLFDGVRLRDGPLFAGLVDRALAILRDPKIPPRAIAGAGEGFTEYECGPVDAVWIGIGPQSPGAVAVAVAVAVGREAPVALAVGQLTVTGGYFQLKGYRRNTYLVDVIPIKLSEDGVGFAVQLAPACAFSLAP